MMASLMPRLSTTPRKVWSALLLLTYATLTGSLFAAAQSSLPDVTVSATVPEVAVDGSSNGVLTFARTGSTSGGLTVNFLLSGTAVKWTDYYRLPQGDMPVSVTIPAGAATATLA